MTVEGFDWDLYREYFRVTIFGSARITSDHDAYQQVYHLARLVGAENIDVVTGGGPGIMEAASRGHHDGRKSDDTCRTIGLNITIPDEQKPNRHLDIKHDFERFSERLDNFMMLSDVVVVAPGGVGTLLELAYTWQLVQVEHIGHIPIILMGRIWKEFLNWVNEYPLKQGYISEIDMNSLYFADDCYEAFEIIKKFHKMYENCEGEYLNMGKSKKREDAEE